MDLQELRLKAIEDVKEQLRNAVKDDWLIIQASSNLDELDKAINLLVKRLREWYELYNPEFSRKVEDHEKFVTQIMSSPKKEKNTMGADLKKEDVDAILTLAKEIKAMYELSRQQEKYLEDLMRRECPNTTSVAGVLIGAKLIKLAGSLERLSKFPASTIQILGAETAFFRHLRNKKNLSPKYGILHEHALVSKTNSRNRGKMARALADKLAISSKVDFFKGKFVGKDLVDKLEKKAKELSR